VCSSGVAGTLLAKRLCTINDNNRVSVLRISSEKTKVNSEEKHALYADAVVWAIAGEKA
jgi:hypothetical protein